MLKEQISIIYYFVKNTILIGIAGNRQNQFNNTQISCNNITESKNYWINKEMYKDLSIFEEKIKVFYLKIIYYNNLV